MQALKIIQKQARNNNDWTPTVLWDDLFRPYANPDTQGSYCFVPISSTPGVEYGYQEQCWKAYDALWLMATEQEAADNSSVASSYNNSYVCMDGATMCQESKKREWNESTVSVLGGYLE